MALITSETENLDNSKDINIVELKKNNINSTIKALDKTIKQLENTSDIKKKAKVRTVTFSSNIDGKKTEVELTDNFLEIDNQNSEEVVLSKLTHDEIMEYALKTKVATAVKKVTSSIAYQFGQIVELEAREIKLTAEIDHENDETYSLILGGRNYCKKDFLELYNLFPSLIEPTGKRFLSEFEKQKKESSKQMEMFPNIESDLAQLSGFYITTNLFSHYDSDTYEAVIPIACSSDGLFAIKFDKKLLFSKIDCYVFYSQFESIVSKILNNKENI